MLHATEYPLVVVVTEHPVLPLEFSLGHLDWWLRGELTRLVISGKFKGNLNESVLFINSSLVRNKNYLLYGTGSMSDLSEDGIISLFHGLSTYLSGLRVKSFILVLSQSLVNHLSGIKSALKGFCFEIYTP